MPGLRNGARRLDRSLRQARAQLACHLARIERAAPLDVHQVRVASRRIRSLLKTFRSHFDRSAADPYRRELGRLARRLGPLRELDVMAGLPGTDAAVVGPTIVAARKEEAARLRRWLRRSAGWRTFAVAKPERTEPKVKSGLDDAEIDQTIRHLWRRVERVLEARPAAPDELHALRIRLKNMRYALEATANPGDEERARLIARLRTAQSLLGEEHDLACARAWLRKSPAAAPAVRATLRQWQRRSRALEARRPAMLRRLRRAGHVWCRSTR